MTQFTTSRIKARELAKSTGGKVIDLNPPRKILVLKGDKVVISDKVAPAKDSPRWLVKKKPLHSKHICLCCRLSSLLKR